MKGYVKGSLWGLVVGGVGLGVVSLVGEQPNFATGPDAPQMASPAMVPSVNTSTLPVPLPSSPDDVPNFADSVPLNVATPDAEAVPDVPTETAQAPTVVAVDEPAPQAATSATEPVLADDAVETSDPAPLVTAAQDDTPAAIAPPAIVVEDQAEAVAADAETTTPAAAAEVTPEAQPEAPVAEDAPEIDVAEAPQDEAPAPEIATEDTASESAAGARGGACLNRNSRGDAGRDVTRARDCRVGPTGDCCTSLAASVGRGADQSSRCRAGNARDRSTCACRGRSVAG